MSETLKQDIFHAARDLGFTLAGVTEPQILRPDAFRDWLNQGFAGTMGYMHNYQDKRLDPQKLVPGTKSILCLGLNYFQKLPDAVVTPDGKIALYAWGRDYHLVVKEMLHKLAEKIGELRSREIRYRAFVDTGPVLEKVLAWQAGLGWIGKNSCLINRYWGSFLFLGELFLDFDLSPDEPGKNYCGKCQRCMDACPTRAITTPHVVDARRCTSYLTIEHRGDIEDELKTKMNGWLFGCDLCQTACPFNRRCPDTAVDDFRRHRLGPRLDPLETLNWDESACKKRTAESAGDRAGLQQWHRNAKIVLENR